MTGDTDRDFPHLLQVVDRLLDDVDKVSGPAYPYQPGVQTVLDQQPKVFAWVFTNPRTEKPFTVSSRGNVFDRAVERAKSNRATTSPCMPFGTRR